MQVVAVVAELSQVILLSSAASMSGSVEVSAERVNLAALALRVVLNITGAFGVLVGLGCSHNLTRGDGGAHLARVGASAHVVAGAQVAVGGDIGVRVANVQSLAVKRG